MESDQPTRSKDRRPPTLAISKVLSENHKWRECKVLGRNISIRSYSAACALGDHIYLYGGYQILNGALGDFYRIALDDEQPTYHWEEIVARGQVHPGSRSKHALLATSSRIYLVGGLKGSNEATNEIYEYDPAANEWALVHPQGVKLPPIESFSAVSVGKGEQERIIIAFGFNEEVASPSNAIYEFTPSKNRLSLLFEGTDKTKSEWPCPRIGCAVATDGETLFIFGGKDESSRLNDLWSFSLSDYRFSRLKDEGEVPAVRNGHSMSYSEGKLYVFGGIHDITWELDDLHIYTLKSSLWTTLEQDSPRKVEKKMGSSEQPSEEKHEKHKKKEMVSQSAYLPRNHAHHAPTPTTTALHSPSRNFTTTYHEEGPGDSPGKMLNEQRKKLFMLKKAEMLANFELGREEREKMVALETASQAMKNSLDVITIPSDHPHRPADRFTDFGKESVSHFLEPLQNNSSIVIGKRPCARDGHCAVVMGDELVILGGDRHQMSFNDIYKLNLKLALRNLREQAQ